MKNLDRHNQWYAKPLVLLVCSMTKWYTEWKKLGNSVLHGLKEDGEVSSEDTVEGEDETVGAAEIGPGLH